MSAIIAFTKVRLPFGWMQNMAPFDVTNDGVTWRTAEALFQAMRFKEDSPVREMIRAERSPMAAKMLAKGYSKQMVVEQCSPVDLNNMRVVLALKVDQHDELAKMLVDTGDATLIEDCTARQRGSGLFWGAALRDEVWVGENWLGRLWMEIRDQP